VNTGEIAEMLDRLDLTEVLNDAGKQPRPPPVKLRGTRLLAAFCRARSAAMQRRRARPAPAGRARAASHPDFNRRSRSSTGSASRGCGRVADYNRRFGVSPTPEHARVTGTSVPHELFPEETGHPRAKTRVPDCSWPDAFRRKLAAIQRSPARGTRGNRHVHQGLRR